MRCGSCNSAGFRCVGWHCRVHAPCLSCLLHGSFQGCSCHTCMKKNWVKVAHQSQDANPSINEGPSLLPPQLTESLVQAAAGPAACATSPASGSSAVQTKLGFLLPPAPMSHNRLRAEWLPLSALLNFSLITKIRRGSIMSRGL